MKTADPVALRPFLPSDAPRLVAIFRSAIEELTDEDYDDDQREAWASASDDAEAFAARLAGHLTLVATRAGEAVGFLTLKDDRHIDLLYVDPTSVGTGVATDLTAAAEILSKARGAASLSVDASDTALGFFQARGYVPERRNTVPRGDVWLSNTTLRKALDVTKGPK
ncbi:GNAT family N-acetyltransferase [Aquabacter cavernae]|uniref:GNAT family N-acetyltransferase n=1 Tax=Aquabacter cavernae TaxID=2496029 RepID=UPI000F8CD452|nr:GNAT family N-acetyltransferase [Aquabacter cavernae]